MKIDNPTTLLQEELKDIYDFEKRLVRAIPKMVKAASSPELRSAFEEHLEATKGQVSRLEQVFEIMGVPAKGKPCAGMKGILEEGEEVMGQNASDEMMDAALIGAAQRVEHYEMAAYGTARALAEHLGLDEAVSLLQETLDEEEEADQKLTEIAQQLLGSLEEGGEDMEEEEEEQVAPKRGGRKAGSSGAV